ncbi:hypothetical protein M3Y98_01114400 [Aphelenchoides besseyi]|nr:hypothetical protein M3Y98_01114400 [Aphelenchoides besseyi]KAI6209185.1 hypothetical protein M3Y96_00194700 [Aphelenchoides besseyi]
MFVNCRFSSFTLHVDRSSHLIKSFAINDETGDKGTVADEFVDKSIDDVCSRNDLSVLERLLESSTSRTAIELSFILRNIAIDAKVKRRLKRKTIELLCYVSKFRSVNKNETAGPTSQEERSPHTELNSKTLKNQQDLFEKQQFSNGDQKLVTKKQRRARKSKSGGSVATKTPKSKAVELGTSKTESSSDYLLSATWQQLQQLFDFDPSQTIASDLSAQLLDSAGTSKDQKPIDFSTCDISSPTLIKAQERKSTKRKNCLPSVANGSATNRLRSMITGGSSAYGGSQFSGQFQTPTTAAGSAAVNNFPKQQYEHSGQQVNSMSSQVANGYPNQMNVRSMPNPQGMTNTGHCMPPNYGSLNSMNPMNMNGMPTGYQQMNVMNQQSNARQQMSWNQQPAMMSNTPNDYLPIYRTPPVMNEAGMYGQQTQNIGMSATPPSSVGATNKKAGQKRKNAQQANANATRRGIKQPQLMNSMQPNALPNQQFQQFPQPAQMFNNQQGTAQHLNGPMGNQFSNPSASMNHLNSYPNNVPNNMSNNYEQQAQWANQNKRHSSESIRQELRTTVQARQNASSPSHPSATMNHGAPTSMAVNDASMPGSRFPVASVTPPSLTGPQRMLVGMQQPNQQQTMYRNQLQQQSMNPAIFAQNALPQQVHIAPDMQNHLSNDFHGIEFDSDFKPSLYQSANDSLHLDEVYDWKITQGLFDMDNAETRSLVQKMLS